jgi:hypothetical protein
MTRAEFLLEDSPPIVWFFPPTRKFGLSLATSLWECQFLKTRPTGNFSPNKNKYLSKSKVSTVYISLRKNTMADFLKGYGPTTSAGEGESEKEKKITKLDLIKKYIINYLLPVMFALIFVCAAACLAVMFYKLQKTNNNLYHNTTLYIEDKI